MTDSTTKKPEPAPPKADPSAVRNVQSKMMMIVGEATGSGVRSMQRLAAMLPKAEALGAELPPDVVEFIEAHTE